MTIEQETARILAPCLYVLNKTGKLSKHHISKILYFADKFHIAKYGRTLSGQRYVAMQNGPVPSQIYDFIKFVEGRSDASFLGAYVQYIGDFIGFIPSYYVIAKRSADLDFLSVSAIKALDESIAKYGNSSFGTRTDESHDSAWEDAWKRPGKNKEISLLEIAKSAGANSSMIDYIKASM